MSAAKRWLEPFQSRISSLKIYSSGSADAGHPTTKEDPRMQDIIYVGITLAFFAVCVLYVRGLDRLVRDGEEGERAKDVTGSTPDPDDEVVGAEP